MQAAFLHESMGGISLWNSRFFTNESILSWLQYFCKNTAIDLEKSKDARYHPKKIRT